MQQFQDGANSNTSILRQVIVVNAKIREVIEVSSGIRLGAINASLIARRAGVRTKGFAVVSAELRIFSIGLEASMLELGSQLARLVMRAAAIAKKERERGCFERARKMAGANAQYLEAGCAQLLVESEALRAAVAQDWRLLGRRIGQLLRACGTGVALICSAKIEAVHGQHFAPALSQVAHAIEEAIGAITEALKQLAELTLEQQRKVA